MERVILHLDMDAFYAAVEVRENPALAGKPLIVGHRGRRGVVSTCSYEARKFGVHSAMPSVVAERLCPGATWLSGRMSLYSQVSREIRRVLDRFSPLVEPLSIDEAFLDLTGIAADLASGAERARTLKRTIRDEQRLTASVGVAPNKFLAKLASDLHKPDGLTVIEPDRIEASIHPLPIGRMWGVGPATEKKLRDLGIATFGELARYPLDALQRRFGAPARHIVQLANGADFRRVVPDHQARSISQEQTFAFDLPTPGAVRDVLLGQVEQVGRRLRRHAFRAGAVTIKVRYGDFQTITRSRSFEEATDRTDGLWLAGAALFDEWARVFRPVRLIGFGAGHLTRGPRQLALFTARADERRQALDRATDSIHEKFGSSAIRRGGG
jgi:DNA polymerase-4